MRLIRHGLASLLAAFVVAPPASAATPVEGYRAPDNRVGCVMYQGFNDDGNAVKCGRRGSSNGLLLPSAGAARKQKWRWPARQLGDLFFTATYGQTLYLYGGTAKLEGQFEPRRSVRSSGDSSHICRQVIPDGRQHGLGGRRSLLA